LTIVPQETDDMGTCGLLGFIIKGKTNGSYNHFDSYPTGLGLDIIEFILSLSNDDIKKMAEQLEKTERRAFYKTMPYS
jgi:hypothetical protein